MTTPEPFVSRAFPLLVEQGKLVEGLQQKQQWAFVYLYDHYGPVLLSLLTKMVNNQEVAEDLLQDSFIKIYKHVYRYDSSKGRFSTWVLHLSRNVALDHIPSKSPCHFSSIRPQQVDSIADVTASNLDSCVEQLVNICLEEKYRIVITLLYFKDYTQQEVADYLHIPLGTVKTRTRMGLQLLRKALSKDQQIYNNQLVISEHAMAC